MDVTNRIGAGYISHQRRRRVSGRPGGYDPAVAVAERLRAVEILARLREERKR